MREVEIPEDVEVTLENNHVKVKGEKEEIERKIKAVEVTIEKKDGKITVTPKKQNKKQKAIAGTIASIINSMIIGVTNGFKYTLEAHYSHFPMNISVQGNNLVIKNFAGEGYPRKIKIPEGVNAKVKGETIELTGPDKQVVSQTAANIEQGTKIKKKDPRVFQDGIYITKKEVME